jgi:CheY-like chemotaxis protein
MKKILIIDDDIDDLSGDGGLSSDEDCGYMAFYVQELRDQQFDVSCVSTVEDALRLVEHSSFDLFIVDLMMDPGGIFDRNDTGNGLKTGARIVDRIFQHDDKARVIVLSNYPDFEKVKDGEPCLRRVALLSKLDTTPSQLTNEIKIIFSVLESPKA